MTSSNPVIWAPASNAGDGTFTMAAGQFSGADRRSAMLDSEFSSVESASSYTNGMRMYEPLLFLTSTSGNIDSTAWSFTWCGAPSFGEFLDSDERFSLDKFTASNFSMFQSAHFPNVGVIGNTAFARSQLRFTSYTASGVTTSLDDPSAGGGAGCTYGIGLYEFSRWNPRLNCTYQATAPFVSQDDSGADLGTGGDPGAYTGNSPATWQKVPLDYSYGADPNGWTIKQFPYGGYGVSGNVRSSPYDGTDFDTNEHGYVVPCWIFSNECHPIPSSDLATMQADGLIYANYSGGTPAVGPQIEYNGIQGAQLYWVTPDSNVDIRKVFGIEKWGDVPSDFTELTGYWMGCPQYQKRDATYSYPTGTGSTPTDVGSGTPLTNSWNASFPEGDDYVETASTYCPYPGMFLRDDRSRAFCWQQGTTWPFFKKDSGVNIPGFEFDRPTWLDDGTARRGASVVSATASVKIGGGKRYHYNFTWSCYPSHGSSFMVYPSTPWSGVQRPTVPTYGVAGNNTHTLFGTQIVPQGDYGVVVTQRDADGTDKTRLSLETNVASGSTGSSPPTAITVKSTNTHINPFEWAYVVYAAVGDYPVWDGSASASFAESFVPIIPKAEPWYPSGHADLVAPDDVTPPTTIFYGTGLIGMQDWSGVVGSTGSLAMPDTCSIQVKNAPTVWDSPPIAGTNFNSGGGGYRNSLGDPGSPRFSIPRGAKSLEFMEPGWVNACIAEYPNADASLSNYQYRFLSSSPAGTTDDLVSGSDVWVTVDMTPFFESLLVEAEDTGPTVTDPDTASTFEYKHSKFRMLPCFGRATNIPDGAKYYDAAGNGYAMNLAGLMENVASDMQLDDSFYVKHTYTCESILQAFDTWQIKDVDATINNPAKATGDDMSFYAATVGTGGNSYRVVIAAATPSQTLTVADNGNDVEVTLGTDGGGTVTTTKQELVDEINAQSSIVIASVPSADAAELPTDNVTYSLSGGGTQAVSITTPWD